MFADRLPSRPTLKVARRSDGGGIELRVTYRRRMRRFGLKDMACSAAQWSTRSARFTRQMPGYAEKNTLLSQLLLQSDAIVDALLLSKEGFTWESFTRHYRNGGADEDQDVVAFMRNRAKAMKASGQVGNARAWGDVATAVAKHARGRALLWVDLSAQWLEGWERELRAGGAEDGGIGMYMRTVRAAYNAASKAGLASREAYPFATARTPGYEMKKLKRRKAPRPMTDGDLQKLRHFDHARYPALSDAVLMVLWMYTARGMNLADLAPMRKVDLRGERYTYTRAKLARKTTRRLSIPLTPERRALLAHFAHVPGPWVFPIYTERSVTDSQKMNRLAKVRKQVNHALAEVSQLLDLSITITTYTPRHTWASRMHAGEVDLAKIRDGLGHSTLTMTEHYLASLGDHAVDETDSML